MYIISPELYTYIHVEYTCTYVHTCMYMYNYIILEIYIHILYMYIYPCESHTCMSYAFVKPHNYALVNHTYIRLIPCIWRLHLSSLYNYKIYHSSIVKWWLCFPQFWGGGESGGIHSRRRKEAHQQCLLYFPTQGRSCNSTSIAFWNRGSVHVPIVITELCTMLMYVCIKCAIVIKM